MKTKKENKTETTTTKYPVLTKPNLVYIMKLSCLKVMQEILKSQKESKKVIKVTSSTIEIIGRVSLAPLVALDLISEDFGNECVEEYVEQVSKTLEIV